MRKNKMKDMESKYKTIRKKKIDTRNRKNKKKKKEKEKKYKKDKKKEASRIEI